MMTYYTCCAGFDDHVDDVEMQTALLNSCTKRKREYEDVEKVVENAVSFKRDLTCVINLEDTDEARFFQKAPEETKPMDFGGETDITTVTTSTGMNEDHFIYLFLHY
jgi:hypothetical protein